jgi:hypothetical protein
MFARTGPSEQTTPRKGLLVLNPRALCILQVREARPVLTIALDVRALPSMLHSPLHRRHRSYRVLVMAVTIEDIRAIRAELQQFDAQQTDFAVRFHAAVVDANLRAASEGHDDPIFRDGLALCVEDLAACIRNPGRGCGSVRCFFCEAALKAKAESLSPSRSLG